MPSMEKRSSKRAVVLLNQSLNDAKISLYTLMYLMLLDVIGSKILKQLPPVKKKASPKNIFKISFENETIAKINPSHTFHDPLINVALPNTSVHFGTPTVVFF